MVGSTASKAAAIIEDDAISAEEASSLPVAASLIVAVFDQNTGLSLTLRPTAGDVSVHNSPGIVDDAVVPEGDWAGNVVRSQVVGDDLSVVKLEDGVNSGIDDIGEGDPIEFDVVLVGIVGEDDSDGLLGLIEPGVTDADQGLGGGCRET